MPPMGFIFPFFCRDLASSFKTMSGHVIILTIDKVLLQCGTSFLMAEMAGEVLEVVYFVAQNRLTFLAQATSTNGNPPFTRIFFNLGCMDIIHWLHVSTHPTDVTRVRLTHARTHVPTRNAPDAEGEQLGGGPAEETHDDSHQPRRGPRRHPVEEAAGRLWVVVGGPQRNGGTPSRSSVPQCCGHLELNCKWECFVFKKKAAMVNLTKKKPEGCLQGSPFMSGSKSQNTNMTSPGWCSSFIRHFTRTAISGHCKTHTLDND